MARDNRIVRVKRDPRPAPKTERDLTTSERVRLLVSDVLIQVSAQIDEKHAQDRTPRKR
ncbi:hypothetical protein [Tateyamaria omphalii]|uniref:hypothetical protein n=1 Tax=Tateyamaria omphalii TaxID=299262 RepID=UPI0012F838F4|nr:hypothetical protein [Tateyamaria omphalii]